MDYLKFFAGMLFGLLIILVGGWVFKEWSEFQILLYIIAICNILIVIKVWRKK